jgi:nitrous oxide reductase accessory protein NosL
MGPELLPFSSDGADPGLGDEHGGETITFDEVDQQFITDYAGGA